MLPHFRRRPLQLFRSTKDEEIQIVLMGLEHCLCFAGTAHHLTDELFVSILTELHYCLKPGKAVHLLDPVLQE